MLGAIAGDIIGSPYEFLGGTKSYHFELFSRRSTFTDDSILSVALADSIMSKKSYVKKLKEYYNLYPDGGYGGNFSLWARSDNMKPYNSYGNGSAMRVSPVAWVYKSLDEVLQKAKESAEVTHNHPEGIKGAQATASAIFLARKGSTKKEIKEYIRNKFNYNLNRNTEEIRKNYGFDVTCQGSVPEAIVAFLDSSSYEDAVRKAVYLGGDTDTQGCIAGSIAEAFYKGVPPHIEKKVFEILDSRLAKITKKFIKKYVKYK
ncbi:MAG: ADP-ribosylglycohydrolase family protein [Spirochaetota bacterium]